MMQRMQGSVEEFLALIKGNNQFSVEEVQRACGEFVRELKKHPPSDLDTALSSLDFGKHAFGVAIILSAKAENSGSSLAKLLQQVETFLAAVTSLQDLPKFLDSHQIFLLMRYVFQRLVRDKMAQAGIELFRQALQIVRENDNQLTEIHSLFLQVCLESQNLKPAVDLLLTEVHEITSNKHCDVQYCISYFFYGAVVLSSYKYFISALRCLEMIFFVPGAAGSSSQIITDAYKKYVLLSVLAKDRVAGLPRGLSTQLDVHLKKHLIPYFAFLERFSSELFDFAALEHVVSLHASVYSQDRNMGLIRHCLKRYKVRELLRTAKVYENMEVANLLHTLHLPDLDALEAVLVDMHVYSNWVGRVDHARGIVAFSKKADTAMPEQTVSALHHSLVSVRTCMESMWNTEKDIISDPEYLRKVMYGSGGPFYDSDTYSYRTLHGGDSVIKEDIMSIMDGVASSGNGFYNTRSGRRTP